MASISVVGMLSICQKYTWKKSRGRGQNLDKDTRPVWLSLKFGQILLLCVNKLLSYFWRFRKISVICLGLKNFQYDTLLFFEWRTHSIEKHKILVAFHIYSNFDKQH